MMDREAMLSHVKESHNRVLALTDGLGDAEMRVPARVDGWSLRDILAHIAAWYELAIERLELIAKGRQREIKWIDSSEVDRLNAEMYRQDERLSVCEVKARYARLGAELCRLIETVSDQEWQTAALLLVDHWLPDFSFAHIQEHEPELFGRS